MERFWSKVNKTEGCWEWTAYKNPDGYGTFGFEGKRYMAHRVAYTLIKGSIPKGLKIDHLCRNRGCVNPLHLEAVTHKINVQRGAGHGGVLSTPKTHCLRGHERTLENLDSIGTCKICSVERRTTHKVEKAEYDRIYREKNKESIAASKKKYRAEQRRAKLGADNK